jgi:hypothetical protein
MAPLLILMRPATQSNSPHTSGYGERKLPEISSPADPADQPTVVSWIIWIPPLTDELGVGKDSGQKLTDVSHKGAAQLS